MPTRNKTYRIVIDTNVWVSFLIGKHLHRLLPYIFDKRIVIVTCKEQLLEFSEVVKKPKISNYFHPQQLSDFFDLLDDFTQLVPISTTIHLCRDPKDDYLLSLSIDANAHYLVSGDKDLLALQQVKDTIIVSPPAFEKILLL